MTKTWLEMLEQNLNQKLEEFLETNTYQEALFKTQKKNDLYNSLLLQKEELQLEAQEQRKNLIELAEKIKQWKSRSNLANSAGKHDLAQQASKYVNQLMDQGRKLWSEFDQLGKEFHNINSKINNLSQQTTSFDSSFEEEWKKLETEDELNHLKKSNFKK